jgi:3-dehydroquinate synthase
LAGGKNLAGAFHLPRAVYADTETLATLPEVEYRSGLGEVVKAAMIDGDLLDELEASADAVLRRDPEVVAGIVRSCVELKERIVERDPWDEGPRKVLNLGHTFAHAIEQQAGYGSVPHGVAVGVGLWLAIEVSRKLFMLTGEEFSRRVAGLLETFGLPRTLGQLGRAGQVADGRLDADGLMSAMKRDKKSLGGNHRLVLLMNGGLTIPDVPVEPEILRQVLEASLAD